MKKIYLILLSLILTFQLVKGQGNPSNLPTDISGTSQTVSPSSTKNYILTYSYRDAVTAHSTSLTTGQVVPEIQYIDGLGRQEQSVSVKATTLGKDLLTYQTYDDYGREEKSYLPYAKSSNNGVFVSESSFISGQSTFLTSIYGSTDGTKGYAETGYENSPLSRVEEQGAPGASWQLSSHPVQYTYSTNTSTVSSWKYISSSYSAISYAVRTLYITQTTDEDGKIVKEYKDKDGRLVQTETDGLKTRYCYDQYGLLRCVVPPLGSSPASTSYCYLYKYDTRKRMTDKYLPGGGWTYYIYDARDRLVLTQDAVQRAKSTAEWTYNVYDELDRVVQSGTWATTTARTTLVSTMASSAQLDYIKNVSGKTPLQYLYYDNYSTLASTYNLYSIDATTLGVTQATTNLGRLTWSETKALDYEADMDYWITSANYYDKFGRVIQTVSDNHLGGKDYITNKYNFTGQVVRTYHRHVADATTTILDENFDYDHRGRLMKTRYTINGGTETLVAANNYDETGNLIDKYLHSVSSSNFLQRLDYTYNIRGWLTQINDPASFSEYDKFGLKLYYNSAPTGGTALYNGNISGMGWGTPTNSNLLYRFTYDTKNRLTAADFYNSSYGSYSFDCSYTYDNNGNFATINRRSSSGSYMDKMTFTKSGNQITSIDDDYADVSGIVDYPGVNGGSGTFTYDSNGNLSYEPTKGITLTYNLLNLPAESDFGSNQQINYFYTFGGSKLRQAVEDDGTVTKIDYCGPFVYETTSGTRSLKYFITPEGRAVKNGSSWDYEYNLTDHLGNVRAVIHDGGSGTAVSIQERHYFPFGMELSELSSGSSTNEYLYNGKEHQNDFELDWYDYGARFYDPALARFHSVDPMTEMYSSQSPFVYADNSPVRFIDFMGMGTDGYTIDEEGNIERVDDTGGDEYDVLYTKTDYENAKQETRESGEKNEFGNPQPATYAKVSGGTMKKMAQSKKSITHPIEDSGGDPTGETVRSHSYQVGNDEDAQSLMKFFDTAFNVEWSNELMSGPNGAKMNLLITSYEESTITGGYYHRDDYWGYQTLRHDHIHPSGNPNPSQWTGDWGYGARVIENFPNAKFRILANGKYYPYTIPKR